MKVKEETVQKITITLNPEEAEWLKGFIQNARDQHESEEYETLRCDLFNELAGALQ